MNKIDHINLYVKYIQDIFGLLKKSGKDELTNNNLAKIFEYYSCVKLQERFDKPFYLYEDIDPNFKELNKMSYSDTGIDACDLDTTIVQCKLRTNYLECRKISVYVVNENNKMPQIIRSNKSIKKLADWI